MKSIVFLGIRSRQRAQEKKNNPVLLFPEKMDQLAAAIDKVKSREIIAYVHCFSF